jgi:hypothetical protein
MSQFGMHLPGSKAVRSASPDVFTALALVSLVFVLVATGVMFVTASKVGVDGSPFGIQEEKNIKLPVDAK